MKQYFLFFFVPKIHFYLTHILFLEHTKMFNLVNITNEHIEQHNLKWPYITDHPIRILIIAGSGSVKTNKKTR